MTTDPVAIARDLVRCRSVTPEEGGALAFLQGTLAKSGFAVYRPTFTEPGTAPVENLYARIGTERPNLMFAGHTDVVPPGDEGAWRYPPFAGEVTGDKLYGRGAVDMKGGIACFVAAALDHLAAHGGKPKRGSLSLLITGDEESIAVNGTIKLLKWAAERGETFDHCILGEPSNVEAVGDTIKAGRRGSLNGTLIVSGRQWQRAFRSVASGIHLGRRWQPDGQSYSRRGACAFQYPLQRLPQPGRVEGVDRAARASRRRPGGVFL